VDFQYPSALHHRHEGEAYLPGSGAWILQQSEFVAWWSSPTSPLLWLHRFPSCGKTKLVHIVVQKLLGEDRQLIDYFYCARNPAEPQHSRPAKVVAGLLRQLAVTRNGILREPVAKACQSRLQTVELDRSGISSLSPLTLAESVPLVLAILENEPSVLVIDAVDECDLLRRHELLSDLRGNYG